MDLGYWGRLDACANWAGCCSGAQGLSTNWIPREGEQPPPPANPPIHPSNYPFIHSFIPVHKKYVPSTLCVPEVGQVLRVTLSTELRVGHYIWKDFFPWTLSYFRAWLVWIWQMVMSSVMTTIISVKTNISKKTSKHKTIVLLWVVDQIMKYWASNIKDNAAFSSNSLKQIHTVHTTWPCLPILKGLSNWHS